jgi:heme/copper-type cytochrome/quinol oxidase subunit 2
MPNINTVVMVLTVGLFMIVTLLLMYGFRTFTERASPSEVPLGMETRQVNPALEVFWTTCAAVLLLAVFAVAR